MKKNDATQVKEGMVPAEMKKIPMAIGTKDKKETGRTDSVLCPGIASAMANAELAAQIGSEIKSLTGIPNWKVQIAKKTPNAIGRSTAIGRFRKIGNNNRTE